MIKQVIVIRKDLNMRKGKMCAQAAHASMKVFLDWGGVSPEPEPTSETDVPDPARLIVNLTDEMYQWLQGKFTKIVVGCDSEEELLTLARKALNQAIHHALIEDSGRTEFHGEKTYTALAIGPDISERIDPITGHLKLL